MKQAEDSYKLFSHFYDSYTKDFKKYLPLYKKLCQGKYTILEVGCGTGRILEAVCDDNKKITGIDISKDMLDIAKVKLEKFINSGRLKLLQHDFTDSPLNEKYEIVLITWYTFNYIIERPEDFLINASKSISENGLLVMDLFYPRTLLNHEINNKWTEKEIIFENKLIKIKDKRNVVNDVEERIQVYEIEGKSERIKTKRKYYSKQKVCELLNNSGYCNIQFIESYDINAMHELSSEEKTVSDFICIAEKS